MRTPPLNHTNKPIHENRPFPPQNHGSPVKGALAVATGDGVYKSENHRALYIVAAEAPQSSDLPQKKELFFRSIKKKEMIASYVH